MRKNAYVPDIIQGIRDQLERADQYDKLPDAQIGMIMIAVGQLLDLTAHLYSRIVDLEKVQNERGEE